MEMVANCVRLGLLHMVTSIMQCDKNSQEIKSRDDGSHPRHNYGPYCILTITPTVKVCLVDKPEECSILVDLDQLRTCPGEMKDVS